MLEIFDPTDLAQLTALFSIILIDIVMSGDNAIIIGMAVAGLPSALRRRAIVIGIVAATVLRICFALIVIELLSVIGLLLAGGLLLLWVCWRMWREIRSGRMTRDPGDDSGAGVTGRTEKKATTMRQALMLIVVADVSMSLDNVLAVGGAAQGHHGLLVFGLVLSIALMAFAANFIAKLLHRHGWIAYLGLAVVVYVACDMTWRGIMEILAYTGHAPAVLN